MIRGPLANPTFRAQFSGHETFPLRHLWLKKAYDQVAAAKDGAAPKSLTRWAATSGDSDHRACASPGEVHFVR